MALLSVTTRPRFTDLTLAVTIKEEIALSGSADDDFIAKLIKQASDAIYKYLDRRLARQVIHEGVASYDRVVLVTNEYPLVLVSQVAQTDANLNSPSVFDSNLYFVSDTESGFIYNETGWQTTEVFGFAGSFTSTIEKLPVQANPAVLFVDYTSGFLMPGDDVIAATGSGTGYSFASGDKSLNKATGKFPILVAGDVFTIAGATSAGNNGQFTVVTATDSKITVAETIVTEAAPANNFSLSFRNLPYDIERAAIETVKGFYFQRDRDWTTSLERIGGTRAGAWQAEYKADAALPPQAINLLTKYKRSA